MKNIFADKVINIGFSVAFIFILIQTMILGLFYTKLPPLLPLYNQLSWGQPRIGGKNEFFIPLFIVICIFSLNLFICYKIYAKMPLVSRIFSQATLLVSFLALFFLVRTILLIT